MRSRSHTALAMARSLAASLAAGIFLASCSDRLFNVAPRTEDLPLVVPEPADNPTTPAKVELGRLLFWDPILSGEKDVACATCHHPARGYADGRDLSLGVGAAGLAEARRDESGGRIPIVFRNAPSIVNAAFNGLIEQNPGDADPLPDPLRAPMLWDNRLLSLEAQALDPLRTRSEMRGDAYPEKAALDSVVARLRAVPDYVRRFQDIFPGPEPITADNLAKAIAAFERTIVAPNSRFDRYVRGDEQALTQLEKRGLFLFTKVGCYRCHSGPMFSDFALHVLGVGEHPRISAPDTGVAQFAFRTPALRNLGFTAPYMHNGTKATLEDAVRFYNRDTSENHQVTTDRLDENFAPIFEIDGDTVEAIVALLRSLDDPDFDRRIPDAVPSGLPVGGRIH